jgi:hypothetical protein
MAHYQISKFSNSQEFLQNVAKRKSKLTKGASPQIDITLHEVLADIAKGSISYHIEAPEVREVKATKEKSLNGEYDFDLSFEDDEEDIEYEMEDGEDEEDSNDDILSEGESES